MESKNTITKASIKSDRCEASYKEHFEDANYTNEVTKKCDQIIHQDLKDAFLALRPFLVTITEQPEAHLINKSNIDEELVGLELSESLSKYFVTGYVRGGSDDSAGVTLIGQKMLKSGQALNLNAPFIKFLPDSADSYPYGAELSQAIDRCDWEVYEYLFSNKCGIRQMQLDFDAPEEATLGDGKPQKRGRGRRKKSEAEIEESVVFDATA